MDEKNDGVKRDDGRDADANEKEKYLSELREKTRKLKWYAPSLRRRTSS